MFCSPASCCPEILGERQAARDIEAPDAPHFHGRQPFIQTWNNLACTHSVARVKQAELVSLGSYKVMLILFLPTTVPTFAVVWCPNWLPELVTGTTATGTFRYD